MEANVFAFDESSQKQRYYDEALDCLLRELHGTDKPFGGKYVIMGGDYGQCFPIVENASQATQLRMSLKNLIYGWSSRNIN